jgi:hypothetical protein
VTRFSFQAVPRGTDFNAVDALKNPSYSSPYPDATQTRGNQSNLEHPDLLKEIIHDNQEGIPLRPVSFLRSDRA